MTTARAHAGTRQRGRRAAISRTTASLRTPAWAAHALPITERAFELGLLLLLAGYLLFDRAFAWLHVPGTPLFIGELVMMSGLLALAITRIRAEAILRLGTPLVILMLLIAWCVLRALPGVGQYGFDAFRDLAIAYYGLFAWLVAMLLLGRERRLWHWVDMYGRWAPWALLWLAPALLLQDVFNERPPFMPDSEISVFSHKVGSIAAHTMLAFLAVLLLQRGMDQAARRRRAAVTLVAVAIVCAAAIVNRGSFVAAATGMLVLWMLERRYTGRLIRRVVAIGLITLTLAFVFDLRISFFSNERELSAQQFVVNMISVVDPSGTSDELSGTSEWRMQYWRRLVADIRQQSPLTGFGFGVNLREKYGEQDEEVAARDTHNSHLGVYARGGLIGLALWALVWSTWFAHMGRVHRAARNAGDTDRANLAAVLVSAIVTILVNAIFDPALEGPQVAIWAWTLFGIGATLGVHASPAPVNGPPTGEQQVALPPRQRRGALV